MMMTPILHAPRRPALPRPRYSWVSTVTSSVVGTIKALLSIGMDKEGQGGGTCTLFDEQQAPKLHRIECVASVLCVFSPSCVEYIANE
jgi:hypothetical protein